MRALALAVLTAAALSPRSARAEAGLHPIQEGLPTRAAERLAARVDERIGWLHDLTRYLGLGYFKPAARPEMYLVSRDYIVAHQREVCFSSKTDEERRACALHVFGWIDDERKIYVLRPEDVTSTEGFPPMRDFPAELWVEMEWTHELVHYIQLERSPLKPTTLPCAVVAKWEGEAFTITAQWLHSLQDVDAERINAVFRGQLPVFRCDDSPAVPDVARVPPPSPPARWD